MPAHFTCYLDESGHHADPKLRLVAMGGLLGGGDAWREFEPRWQRLLAAENVTTFHMKDFENYRGEFEGWTKERHQSFLAEIVGFLVGLPSYYVGLTLRLSEVGPIREKYGKGFDPYYMLFQLLSEQLVRRINTIPPQEIELDLGIAHHPEYSGNVHRAFEGVRRDSRHPERLRSLEVKPVRDVPALQAADLIAYETLKYQTNVLVENSARPTRWPMRQFAQTNRYLIQHGNVDEVRE